MKQPNKRIPIYLQIREYITEQIHLGSWKPGDTLPSENELARLFQGSRITVKQALKTLVEEGVVYRVQGKGSFVAEGADSIMQVMDSPVSTNSFSLRPVAGAPQYAGERLSGPRS